MQNYALFVIMLCCSGFRRASVKAASSARSSSQLISGDIRDEHAHPGNPRQSFAVGAGGHDSRLVMWTSRPESCKSASPGQHVDLRSSVAFD